MTPPGSTQSNNETFGMILAAVSEVKAIVSGLDERVRLLERATIEQSVTATNKLEALFRRVDEHASLLRALQDDLSCKVHDREVVTSGLDRRLSEVEGITRFIKWLGAAVGGLIIVLIWGILTHTITIATP
jgi:hypothetical protein